MFCAACGAQNAESNRFCLACGSTLQAAPTGGAAALAAEPTASSAASVCPACHKSYSASQRFCEDDGTALVAPGRKADARAESAAPPAAATFQPSDSHVAAPAAPKAPDLPPLVCPTCGAVFPAGSRFCDHDGTPLGTGASRPSAAPEARPGHAGEPPDEYDDEEESGGSRRLLPALLAVLVVMAVGALGYLYWSGKLDALLAGRPADKAHRLSGADKPGAVVVPGLAGSYAAHIADQDIVLAVSGEKPLPLVSAHGRISYQNTVNGGACVADLVPTKGGGFGGDTSNAVSFRQVAVPGKPACSADIPVEMDVAGQPVGKDGVVGAVAVEWHSPGKGAILMSGKLSRTSK
jgi:hypothetical protein